MLAATQRRGRQDFGVGEGGRKAQRKQLISSGEQPGEVLCR